MVDPWIHALNLNKAVEQGGVAQARVAQEDYEGVKPLMRQVWRGERWRNLLETIRSQNQVLIPAHVLLGYLRGYFLYREVPENDRAFWPNFLKDLGIEGRHLPTQVEYDRLWGVLDWHDETSRCLKFHENGARDFIGTLDAIFHFKALRLNALKDSFLAFYQTGVLPERAQPYERVFRKLQAAMELLLEEEAVPDLCDEGAVLGFLQEAGLYLGEPDPVRLLFNRSDKALHDLYWELRGDKPAARQKSTRLGHKQVRVELLKSLPSLEEIRPTLNREPLLEGWKVYGKLTLEDGRFRRFDWVPRFTTEGDPIPEELEVSFEEGEIVRFRLHHQAFAIRFSELVWKLGEPLEVRPIGFDPAQHPLRFLLASEGEARERPEELAQKIGEGSAPKDELVVEVRTDGRGDEWRRIAVLPVEVRVRLEAWVGPQGAFVRTHPPGFAVRTRVLAGERLVREEELVRTEAQGTLVARSELVPLRVEVCLGSEVLSLALAPRGWPQNWWRLGLGLERSTKTG
ncbi:MULTISPECIES: transcription antiterminator BglG [unclassified Meiothermus]|uniref:transcription antiterminator BglG n=1 Tax=unclassified Meiothermus TaxID=370471 RepID=UPI000D7C1B85|nr:MULTISPECIES: transcription antiterminator BglG [unclassified Meiothermus]PZA07721.1 transcription antiterminator BglG [Meiothermus sp. Pnk-1]RYM37490.1 transcription antiterminator BglG [Meiothermus sp. PNK-Is4]